MSTKRDQFWQYAKEAILSAYGAKTERGQTGLPQSCSDLDAGGANRAALPSRSRYEDRRIVAASLVGGTNHSAATAGGASRSPPQLSAPRADLAPDSGNELSRLRLPNLRVLNKGPLMTDEASAPRRSGGQRSSRRSNKK
jgi:hypothetical protein